RRENDKKIGAGTMSRSGAYCPCCSTPDAPIITSMEDIRLEGKAGRLGATMTAVVVDGPHGKEYRLPIAEEIKVAAESAREVDSAFAAVPFGIPDEPLAPARTTGNSGFRILLYGIEKQQNLYSPRQLVTMATFVSAVRSVRETLQKLGEPGPWVE